MQRTHLMQKALAAAVKEDMHFWKYCNPFIGDIHQQLEEVHALDHQMINLFKPATFLLQKWKKTSRWLFCNMK